MLAPYCFNTFVVNMTTTLEGLVYLDKERGGRREGKETQFYMDPDLSVYTFCSFALPFSPFPVVNRSKPSTSHLSWLLQIM